MNARALLPSLLTVSQRPRVVSPDIYSILPSVVGRHLYDRRAALYDRIVVTRLYNRLVWGNSPQDYTEFARQAVRSGEHSWLLDAGGGSLLFTADIYAECRARPILVLDQSLEMLTRAHARLIELAGSIPEHIVLLQADLSDLTGFIRSGVGTVVCLNVLHHVEAAATLIHNLAGLLDRGERKMFVTSLIMTGRLADLYLRTLYFAGGFARPRTEKDIRTLFQEATAGEVTLRVQGSMAYVTVAVPSH